MDGMMYNQQDAFVKLEIPTGQTTTTDYTLRYAVTKKMFLGPAQDAPDNITLVKGYLAPGKNNYETVMKFQNRYSKYLYLTITRLPTADCTDLTIFYFQASHP